MTPLHQVIINKNTKVNPIWIMRQAGRYLPEFREIRKQNPNFINLCLNENLSSEITLQPLKRFALDAAIIFSDILMLPYGLNQKVKFEKGFGPKLGEVNIEEMSKLDEVDFVEKIYQIIFEKKVDSEVFLRSCIFEFYYEWSILPWIRFFLTLRIALPLAARSFRTFKKALPTSASSLLSALSMVERRPELLLLFLPVVPTEVCKGL